MKAIKYFSCIVLLAVIPISAQSTLEDSIIFSAKTEKPSYQYGDSILLIFTIENLSDTTVTLIFGSSCQFDYFIDDFHFLDFFGCSTIITYLFIPPDTTVHYYRYHDNSIYSPEIGIHNFTGILIGYDTASTKTFNITEATSIEEYENMFQITYILNQNFPNPFNPVTSIQYAISSRQFVTLKVYDILGNEIATLVNEEKPAGTYEVEFDGTKLSSGIYFYQLKAGQYSEAKKMILLK